MERVRYGVPYLNFLPILLTDATSSNQLTDAELTQKILKNEFLVQARWLERQSRTTQENAAFSIKMLEREGITHIYLVIHFWHIPRA